MTEFHLTYRSVPSILAEATRPLSFGQLSINRSYASQASTNTHVLKYISVPEFDPTDPLHKSLVKQSAKAHVPAARGEETILKAIETEVDELAAKLWGLKKEELKDIQNSLSDLRS